MDIDSVARHNQQLCVPLNSDRMTSFLDAESHQFVPWSNALIAALRATACGPDIIGGQDVPKRQAFISLVNKTKAPDSRPKSSRVWPAEIVARRLNSLLAASPNSSLFHKLLGKLPFFDCYDYRTLVIRASESPSPEN
jgi:hypothetical protein